MFVLLDWLNEDMMRSIFSLHPLWRTMDLKKIIVNNLTVLGSSCRTPEEMKVAVNISFRRNSLQRKCFLTNGHFELFVRLLDIGKLQNLLLILWKLAPLDVIRLIQVSQILTILCILQFLSYSDKVTSVLHPTLNRNNVWTLLGLEVFILESLGSWHIMPNLSGWALN